MSQRFLTALPVYNEVRHVREVIREVLRYSREILIVDDGSTDGTSELLAGDPLFDNPEIHIIRHEKNQGYGAALQTAFEFAEREGYDIIVTIDSDGQHEPQRIPAFVAACADCDLVSGSRYLAHFSGDSAPPPERRRINQQLTDELNRRLGLRLTDAFCGFKAYRVSTLQHLHVQEPGYAMPLELWVRAAQARLRIKELPVPLIYLDEKRSFGGALDDGETRLQYYHLVLDRAFATVAPPRFVPGAPHLWTGTLALS